METGKSRVWVNAGYWLYRLTHDDDQFDAIWCSLAKSSRATIRFRVAAYINSLPERLTSQILPKLLNDRSDTVREKAYGDIENRPSRAVRSVLQQIDRQGLERRFGGRYGAFNLYAGDFIGFRDRVRDKLPAL